MSNVKVNTINDASGGSNAVLYGVAAPTNSMGFRNRIINGGMQIWQRGTSFTVAQNAWTYTADRFGIFSPNTSTTVSQNTSVPSGIFQYSLKLQRPAGNTGTSSLVAVQVIESNNCFDLSSQAVTLSFWAKAGANYSGGNLTVQVATGTVADQGIGSIFGGWTGQSNAINTSQALTSTWTKYTFTGTAGAGVLESGVILAWAGSGTAGADDSVYITGVQLEAGSVASPFERVDYGRQLMMCQRYYWQVTNFSATVGVYRETTSLEGAQVSLPVSMRTSPTCALPSLAGLIFVNGGATAITGAITVGASGANSVFITLSSAAQPQNAAAWANITSTLTASVEL